MSYVIPLGFCRVSFDFEPLSSTGSAPSFGFGLDSVPTSDVTDGAYDWWTVQAQELFNESCTLKRITARSDVGFAERIVGQNGGAAGTFAPPQISVLVKMSSGLAGRKNRGRMYLPFLLEDATTDEFGRISNSARDAYQGIVDALPNFCGGPDSSFVILHSDSSDPTPVTEAVVQTQSATQRRRNRR